MTNELREGIEKLYAAFSGYGLAAHVPGCPCCTSPADNDRIHSAPLRSLGACDLEAFAFKAMSTWGTAGDFRHFIPRIFELLAIDGGIGWVDAQVVLGKLPYGEWRQWPATEQQSVERYLRALWSEVSRTPEHPFDVDDCLCSIAQAVDDLAPYLDAWRPDRSAGEATQFANWAWDATWKRLKAVDGQWRIQGAWWDGRPAPAVQAAAWLLAPARVAELESAFFAFELDDEAATAVSEATNVLAGLRAAVR